MMDSLLDQQLSFVGGGNMAGALIGGLIEAGLAPSSIRVLEIHAATAERLARSHGVLVSDQPADVFEGSTLVLLAVKPQQMAAVCRQWSDWLAGLLTVSIAAGVRLTDLSRWLAGHRLLVRAMPNTPALVQAGITGLYAWPEVDGAGRQRVAHLMAAVGGVVWVDDEALLDAITAVSGSGPAYVFHFIEGLIAAGVQQGLPEAVARQLALETVAGSARLALGSQDSPAVLRARVTSPGGTTQAALESFARSDLLGSISQAVAAATRRARELGEQFGQD